MKIKLLNDTSSVSKYQSLSVLLTRLFMFKLRLPQYFHTKLLKLNFCASYFERDFHGENRSEEVVEIVEDSIPG